MTASLYFEKQHEFLVKDFNDFLNDVLNCTRFFNALTVAAEIRDEIHAEV
jgi:hypothetical protein